MTRSGVFFGRNSSCGYPDETLSRVVDVVSQTNHQMCTVTTYSYVSHLQRMQDTEVSHFRVRAILTVTLGVKMENSSTSPEHYSSL